MKLLIVAATELELKPLLKKVNFSKSGDNLICKYKNIDITVLISGIGMVSTSYALTKALHKNSYNLVLNAGIAGCFNKNIELGSVYNVTQEQIGDMVIEDGSDIKTLFQEKLVDENQFPYINGKLINPENIYFKYFNDIHTASSITVNTVHGNEKTISLYKEKYNAELENMEGAAVFYTCMMEKQDFIEFRAVSNYIEPRNKDNWDIPLAINNLNNRIIEFLEEVNEG